MYYLKRLLVLLLIVAPFVYAYRTRPTFEEHIDAIYAQAYGSEAEEGADVSDLPQWERLRFRDYLFVTATSDVDQMNMVTYGFLHQVKVVDDEWGPKAFDLIPPKD